MSPDKRKQILRKKDILQTEIAAEFNVRPCAISLVLSGRFRSRRLEEAIADKAGLTYEEMWGDKPRRRAA